MENTTVEKSARAPDIKEFLTTEDLAEFLNVSKKSIVKWRDAKRLPGAIKCGRIWRFRRCDIEKRLLSGELLLPKHGAK